jgi:hypothetical protein
MMVVMPAPWRAPLLSLVLPGFGHNNHLAVSADRTDCRVGCVGNACQHRGDVAIFVYLDNRTQYSVKRIVELLVIPSK